MQKNLTPAAAQTAAIKPWKKYKKQIVITLSVTALNLVFGFDPKFTIINIIWLFI